LRDIRLTVFSGSTTPLPFAQHATDPEGDPLTFSVPGTPRYAQPTRGPSHGTIVQSGDPVSVRPGDTFRYVADPDYVGSDWFTWEADDGLNGTAIARVLVTIVKH
jgi:hypothetical protein